MVLGVPPHPSIEVSGVKVRDIRKNVALGRFVGHFVGRVVGRFVDRLVGRIVGRFLSLGFAEPPTVRVGFWRCPRLFCEKFSKLQF